MKKLKYIALLGIMAVMLSGCVNTSTQDEKQTSSFEEDINSDGLSDWIDPESGVHYWMYRGYYKVSMAPRYNSDGTMMIDDVGE